MEFDGDGFLYKMVRLMVGTTVLCAQGKVALSEITRRFHEHAPSGPRLVAPAALVDSALELAGQLAARPPVAVAWVLRAMTAGSYESLSSGLATEAEGSCVVGLSKDSQEGFKAFLEKRPPVFTGE
jgi:hypothetical protein